MKSKLPILLPILLILLLVFIFFDRIPVLGSGDLGPYPFLVFILAMMIMAIWRGLPRMKAQINDYVNYFSSFKTESGSKLLFFRGNSAVGAPIASRGYGGYSRIKLSDGRKIKVWSNPFAGMAADTFYFKGAGNKGELKKENIILNDVEYLISAGTETTLNLKNSNYTINDRELSLRKDGVEIAKIKKFLSGTYLEANFIKELTAEEFLLANLFLMDVYILYVPRMAVTL